MANTVEGEISIRLDRVRTICFDFPSYVIYEERTNRTIMAALRLKDQLGFLAVCELLWAGLRHEQPDLTFEETANLAKQAEGANTFEKFQYVLEKVIEAIVASFGDAAKKKYEEGVGKIKKMPGTGKSS